MGCINIILGLVILYYGVPFFFKALINSDAFPFFDRSGRMATLTALINQVEDKSLRKRLLQEAGCLSKQKKFDLVFEEHIPKCTPQ